MFDALKKWVAGRQPAEGGAEILARWARQRQMVLREDQAAGGWFAAGDGLSGLGPTESPTARQGVKAPAVLDGGDHVSADVARVAWSLEWGPSQRPYISGSELRLRAELPVASTLQALVLDRPLQVRMEREVFETYVQDLHTRVDTGAPPEMRWLVVLPAVPPAPAAALGEAFSAVASDGLWATRWLDGPLPSLLAGGRQAVGEDPPLVLMLSRSRLTLRTALEAPQASTLDVLAATFRAACDAAMRASAP
jgi:hypothetical protein